MGMEVDHGYPFHDEITATFHAHYRNQSSDHGPPFVKWMGYDCLKCPLDLWIYQEILFDLKPDYVIECGTAGGGTALFLASVCESIGEGWVLSVDWEANESRPKHPRISYLQGDTEDTSTAKYIRELVSGTSHPVVLILDDGHAWEHVLAELELLTPILKPGDYLIVEDTNLGGPLWGLDKFLEGGGDRRFIRDPYRERLLLTFNPRGYLKCVA